MPRPVADDARRVEARQVPPGGRIGLRWGDIAFATLARDGDVVKVSYRWCNDPGESWRETAQEVRLAYLACPFGGRRTFLCCPSCQRRAIKLYHHPAGEGGFTCRRCAGLVPRAQSEGSWQRALRRAAKIRCYCGGSGDVSQPFPERPLRMTRAVYQCLRHEAERLETAVPIQGWVGSGTANVRLGIRRSPAGRRWWPARNWSGSDRRPGHGG